MIIWAVIICAVIICVVIISGDHAEQQTDHAMRMRCPGLPCWRLDEPWLQTMLCLCEEGEPWGLQATSRRLRLAGYGEAAKRLAEFRKPVTFSTFLFYACRACRTESRLSPAAECLA